MGNRNSAALPEIAGMGKIALTEIIIRMNIGKLGPSFSLYAVGFDSVIEERSIFIDILSKTRPVMG